MLRVVMLSVRHPKYCYANCCYAECRYAECHYANSITTYQNIT
jgi:hypothetical protein